MLDVPPIDKSSQADTMRCPTCRANQPWSDTCRRCKCDLSLVHQMLRHRRTLHRACLNHLRRGNVDNAIQAARQIHQLMASATSRRLLAVCSAIGGDLATAVRIAEQE
jgi:hypothetical protein